MLTCLLILTSDNVFPTWRCSLVLANGGQGGLMRQVLSERAICAVAAEIDWGWARVAYCSIVSLAHWPYGDQYLERPEDSEKHTHSHRHKQYITWAHEHSSNMEGEKRTHSRPPTACGLNNVNDLTIKSEAWISGNGYKRGAVLINCYTCTSTDIQIHIT